MTTKPRTTMNVSRNDGRPAQPLGWLEEHIWPVRVLYALLGLSHCGKRGWRR